MTATPRAAPLLPTGTVTFLFTDVEGSTRLWEAHRAAMQTALARHDALLRQCIEGHGGHVVKSVGDGVCAAFDSATDALEASIAAQQVLAAESWPEPVQIRVRMALHSGPAEMRDGDYFGPTLNRVARLLALGRGGQTLVSAITYDLCRHYLPTNVLLRSLGEHTLKDLDRPEAVFEVTHDRSSKVAQPKAPLVPPELNTPSIAVLPFVNMSRDEENEYFADGLAEELLNVLSKIRGLRVVSRTSSFSFKGTKLDIPTVAQKLNVATILEGSVRKSGKRVRITAQLIEVATDSHLWSNTYDRELEDIFAVQDDIAQSVVKELRAALLGEKADVASSAPVKAEVQAAAKGRGENAEAYRLYLQGRFFEDRFTRHDTAKAIAYYQQALAIDSDYALAFTALSRAYSNQASYSWDTTVFEGYAKAREAAERSLQLDPDLVEGHAALGQIRMFHDFDWKGADASFRRALELSPGDASVLRDAGVLARNLGRSEEGLALVRRAVALDPLNASTHLSLARSCLFANLVDEAEAEMSKALELNPLGELAHFWLGRIRIQQKRLEDAEEMFQRETHDTFRLLGLSHVHQARGRSAESEAALHELIEKDASGAAFQIAMGYAYRGETDLAFEWLERAYLQRDPGLGVMKVAPQLHTLHGDPRWQPFLKKMALAD